MIQSASNYPLSILFNPDQNIKYTIPKYQREYVWQQHNWEALFDDILEGDKGHFLGSIICINHSTDALQTLRLELVDGQQRVTTTSLLYTALYTWLKQNADQDDDDIRVEMAGIRNRLVQKNSPGVTRLEPSLQGKNLPDYEYVLHQASLLKRDVDKLANVGKRRIDRAYRYFLSRLNETDENNVPVFTSQSVLDLLEKLNSASMVKIEVSSHSDAFTLFETLNNRGEPLSALDLIKNKLLDVLEKQNINTIDQNFNRWTRLLDNLTDDPATQQRYLRQYYNAFKYRPEVAVKGFSKATRSTILTIYARLIDADVRPIFDDLYDKSQLYSRLVRPDHADNAATVTSALLDLQRIGGVTSQSFLLFLLGSYPSLPSAELGAIIQVLVTFFVRRNVTDLPPTRDLDKLFIELIDWCRQQDQHPTSSHVRAFLRQPVWYVPDEVFSLKLMGNLYQDNADAARFVLCSLEGNHQTHETYTDLWRRSESKQYVWTIEHILPQGKNLPAAWVDMIGNGDEVAARHLQETHVHRLGNLTISGYNSTLGNQPFSDKRDRTDKKGHPVGYRNGLYLNRLLAEKDSWTAEDIETRTIEMVKDCIKLFSI
ncbi:DUF262 domain-containing protein [Fibrivirga algicola]|uniref:DUF262 domain-containing protein n=1 Tax=Fibrivirga algicola TaxID=2950420 RepID=A0ABX0QSJ6_9BACT|nr:DUF262 domain-containing protein [Fibrivirga algicola]NID13518.1 DUF262 domain-containing protein [Fibrivirga algicola]